MLCNNQIVTTLICIEGWDFHAVNTCLVFSFTSYNFTAAFVVWPKSTSLMSVRIMFVTSLEFTSKNQ